VSAADDVRLPLGKSFATDGALLARRIVARTVVFAAIPLLPIATVLYNARHAPYRCFLRLVVPSLPGRVEMFPPADRHGPRQRTTAHP
jgi:hypothetical protein